MGKYFGTDGFRGEAGTVLTADHAYAIGRFIGWYFTNSKLAAGERGKILIGQDTRRSGDCLQAMLVGGITASGADAYLLGTTTTPSVAYLVVKDSFDCGIMISASHNPFRDNGIKLMNYKGEKMEPAFLELLEAYMDGEPFEAFEMLHHSIPFASGAAMGVSIDYRCGIDAYVSYLTALAKPFPKNLRIGIDCANGSASHIARRVFEQLGADVCIYHNEPDGLNINVACGSTHLENLARNVVEQQLDCGFAYDGDADRCLAVDENGDEIDGDAILYIYGRYLKKNNCLKDNTVVTTIMSNFGLYKAFDRAQIAYAATKVGDKYVTEYMRAHDCSLGGEQSGHIIFSDYATTGDGILTSLMMLKVMAEEEKSLCELREDFTAYPQVLKNIRVTDKAAARQDQAVCDAIQAALEALGDTGRILVRESGTEPVIRVMAEAGTLELCHHHVDAIVGALSPYVVD